MHLFKILVLSTILFLITPSSEAQAPKRLLPGKMYSANDTIYAPRHGFTSEVPEGWQGTLPRDMEIFLLLPDTIASGGEIFSFGHTNKTLDDLRKSWMQGVQLSETIGIKAKAEVGTEGEMIYSEVVATGIDVNTGNAGFVAARCSPFGHCITSLALGPKQFYESMKAAVMTFTRKARFSEPSNVSIYADLDWQKFLSNKMLIALMAVADYDGGGKKDNTIHLCSNGTFKASIKKKGAMKQFNPQYKGNLSGKWTAEGIGEKGLLKLTFEKLDPLQIPLTIKDEKIFANDERYFIGESDRCDK